MKNVIVVSENTLVGLCLFSFVVGALFGAVVLKLAEVWL
jgi:hypothetical protein